MTEMSVCMGIGLLLHIISYHLVPQLIYLDDRKLGVHFLTGATGRAFSSIS